MAFGSGWTALGCVYIYPVDFWSEINLIPNILQITTVFSVCGLFLALLSSMYGGGNLEVDLHDPTDLQLLFLGHQLLQGLLWPLFSDFF